MRIEPDEFRALPLRAHALLFEDEQLSELRNATVHAFVSLSIQPTPNGYMAYAGIFVKPAHRLTGLSLAFIAPFRHLVVYPAVIRKMQRAWAEAYGGTTSQQV